MKETKYNFIKDRLQVVRFQTNGTILETCETLLALKHSEESNVFDVLPIVSDSQAELAALGSGERYEVLGVEISFGEKSGVYDLRFNRMDGGAIELLIYDNTAAYHSWQQDKNQGSNSSNQEEDVETLRNALIEKNKELESFAYIVSHDLKAPLRGIRALSEWIAEDLEGKMDEDTAKNFSLLKSRTQRLEDLINGILMYSRAGISKGDERPVNMQQILQDAIQMLAFEKPYEVQLHENLPTITADLLQIDQVFSHLFNNAIKFCDKEKAEVAVTYQDAGNFHQFSVKDNGPGIPAEFHDTVFEPFSRLDNKEDSGCGIGLAIVKKVIEKAGGKIWIESDETGANFMFTWPKAA